jgi:hypothetical protein
MRESSFGQIGGSSRGKGHFRRKDGPSSEVQAHRTHFFRSTERNVGPLLAICFIVASAMFGCSEQRAPQTQYSLHPRRLGTIYLFLRAAGLKSHRGTARDSWAT